MRTIVTAGALAALLGLAIGVAAAAAETVVIQPSSQDAFIQKDKPNRIAGAGPTNTRVRVEASLAGNKTRRGLVQFDLSAIPAGSTVTSATLDLFEGNSPNNPVTHGAHRATEPWLQSAVKWNTQPAHTATPTDTALVPDDTLREFRAFDVTTDVQDYVSLCETNHGWVIRDQAEAGSSEDVNYVAREENDPVDNPAHLPRLTIDFTRPTCTVDADCADTNFCTENERCVGGLCTVDAVDCDDADPCTDDICDCTSGCINAPICNDGFACTIDSCDPVTLACTSAPVDALCALDCSTGNCEADPDRTDLDPFTGCFVTSTSPVGTPCSDGDPCTDGDACDGAGTCVTGDPSVCDHYVAFKAKPAPDESLPDKNKLQKDWNISLDAVLLANTPPELFPEDPENYVVKKPRSIVNPAMKDDEPGPFQPDLHYLRYQIKPADEGVGPESPPASGKFPKTQKAPKRLWHVTNQFGDLFLETKKVRSLWVPTGKAEAPAIPPAPGDATHYICYQAKAAKIPSAQAPDLKGSGKGKFRKDLQHFFLDQFDDCALTKDGAVAFAGTAVEGKCLYTLKKPLEICSPADKTAVVPPRFTTATIDESIAAVRGQAILCYQAKLAKKIRDSDAGTLAGLAVDANLGQSKHAKRSLKSGTQVNTTPGNQFPRPLSVETKKTEMACVPTEVLSISDL